MSRAADLLELIADAVLPLLGEPGTPVAVDRAARDVWANWSRDADARAASPPGPLGVPAGRGGGAAPRRARPPPPPPLPGRAPRGPPLPRLPAFGGPAAGDAGDPLPRAGRRPRRGVRRRRPLRRR